MINLKATSFLNILLSYKFNINQIISTFLLLIFIRLFGEWSIYDQSTPLHLFYEVTHTTFFFYIYFIICTILLVKIAKFPPTTSILLTLFAFIFVIFPPLIDWFISVNFFNGIQFFSYYLFDSPQGLLNSFLTFFGDKPRDGITYGSRILIGMTIAFFSTITYLNTKSILRSLVMGLLTYTISFLLSALPSLLTFVISPKHFRVTNFDIAGLIASPTTILNNQISEILISINVKMSLVYIFASILITLILLFISHKAIFISLVKNIRPIQTTYHLGLLIIGIGLAIIFTDTLIIPSFFTLLAFILLCISIIFAWSSTVIFNDCIDQNIDKISNPNRPLILKTLSAPAYKRIGLILGIMSVTIVTAISPPTAIALITYHALSYIYNIPPMRLKRFPIIGTFIAAFASLLIVFVGFITISPSHTLDGFPSHIAILMLVAYTISLPIKDLKDIAGDKVNNIYTLPVLFGENISRMLIATSIFISLLLSVYIFGIMDLIVPALFSGALSFWTLVSQKNNKFIFTPHKATTFVFLIVSIYAIILAILLFI